MKRQRIVLVRSVSLALVGLLLFLAGWGHTSMGAEPVGKTPVQKTGTAQKAGKTAPGVVRHSDRTDAPADNQVSMASFEAVVTPATSFDFGETVWLLPPPVMAVLLLLAAVTIRFVVSEPYFYFSYFRNVFGHFIAPNAP
ncbi:MAG: hypothetical protein LH609_09495 [Rudanella sp.]|nr:hypothetical protein [Rudanella sp.]